MQIAICPGRQRLDITLLRGNYIDHVVQHMPHAQLLGAVLLQEGGEFTGIQVIGIISNSSKLGGRWLLWRPPQLTQCLLGTEGRSK